MKLIKLIKNNVFLFGFIFIYLSNPNQAMANISEDKYKIIFIGNSITKHERKEDLGWYFNHGMAVNDKNKDYVHNLMKMLEIKSENAYIRNFYPFETKPNSALGLINSLDGINSADPQIVIIQLGDNVSLGEGDIFSKLINGYEFLLNYDLLIKNISKNDKSNKVYCISTWWEQPLVDFIIKLSCFINKQNYVFIGDIYNDKNNKDRLKVDFQNVGVDIHPKEWGMLMIANRIFKAISSIKK